MEKQLKLVMLLSLEEMALRRVVISLFNSSDVSASISKFQIRQFDSETREWWETIDNKIKDKIMQLQLPESLTKQMIGVVRPISSNLRIWRYIHQNYSSHCREKIELPDSTKLCWTTTGAINYRKTAEELVRYDKINIVRRYEIACEYCLEDYIPLLWEKLPEEKKEFFQNERYVYRFLPFCWSHMVKGDFSKLNLLWVGSNRNLTSFNQWAFEQSAREVNKSAVEYFFQKLTHAERGASLMRTARALLANLPSLYFEEEKLSNVLCYLLSVMTPEQQMEAIKAHPVTVYSCFRRFPLSDLFLENTSLLWPFLPPSSYDDLLEKVILRYDKIYFSKLFPEFFKQSSPDYKRFFVSGYDFVPAHGYLKAFFEEGDSESIEVILRNLDAADRVKLVFNRRNLSLFYDNICEGRWPIVEVFLREATLSNEEKKRMKDIFIERSRTELQELCKNPKLKVFYDFLDEADDNADTEKKARKRKLEDCCPE